MTTMTTEERRAPALHSTVAYIEGAVRTRARIVKVHDRTDPRSLIDLAISRQTGTETKKAVRYGHTAGHWTTWG